MRPLSISSASSWDTRSARSERDSSCGSACSVVGSAGGGVVSGGGLDSEVGVGPSMVECGVNRWEMLDGRLQCRLVFGTSDTRRRAYSHVRGGAIENVGLSF